MNRLDDDTAPDLSGCVGGCRLTLPFTGNDRGSTTNRCVCLFAGFRRYITTKMTMNANSAAAMDSTMMMIELVPIPPPLHDMVSWGPQHCLFSHEHVHCPFPPDAGDGDSDAVRDSDKLLDVLRLAVCDVDTVMEGLKLVEAVEEEDAVALGVSDELSEMLGLLDAEADSDRLMVGVIDTGGVTLAVRDRVGVIDRDKL